MKAHANKERMSWAICRPVSMPSWTTLAVPGTALICVSLSCAENECNT